MSSAQLRQFGEKDGVDLRGLGTLHDSASLAPVVPGFGCGFPEDAGHLVACAVGKSGEFGQLALA